MDTLIGFIAIVIVLGLMPYIVGQIVTYFDEGGFSLSKNSDDILGIWLSGLVVILVILCIFGMSYLVGDLIMYINK